MLVINVTEAPIIDKVELTGIRLIKSIILKNIIKLKSRSSYNDFLFRKIEKILLFLKTSGYYFAEVETVVQNLDNNLVKLNHIINLGEKAKIKKISF